MKEHHKAATYLDRPGNTLLQYTQGSCKSWLDMGLVDKLLHHAVWVSRRGVKEAILECIV